MNFSIKDDFPIFKNNPGLVYLDSAASAQKPLPVIAAMADFLSKDYANIHRGLYPLSERAGAAWESARSKAAAFAGADPDEIIFTRGTTSSLNFLARALAGGEAFVSAAE
ncbi:MAG: aminotransferase class V-fold PLP-dependent enzyme, partial [Rickettsiales bacterium]|nr:aminotransferase class V-fold PLP-dependent enzyme [Rickettsiales bacterium]